MKWFIIGVCCGIILGYGVGRYNRPLANTKYIYRDKYIRDSLYIVNDSIQTKIKYLNKIYYVKKDSVLANDSSADMQFFTNYINSYEETNKNR